MSKEQLYTPEGYQKLVDELNYLTKTRREEIKKDIAEARSFGDLSENAEYDAARNEQAKVEARIKELEELIRHAKIIDEEAIDTTVVSIGSVVKVERNGKDIIEYSIVGSNEADPDTFKISDQSPIGRKLIGVRAGSNVVVEVPSGKINFKVLEVSRAKEDK
ncbi:MAG: transcription elongation factor GreA [Ruminococcaceae bacterium]|nr:transcription elongation factor GreA [Oscillospiraceae bacterium]